MGIVLISGQFWWVADQDSSNPVVGVVRLRGGEELEELKMKLNFEKTSFKEGQLPIRRGLKEPLEDHT